jgi:hypothetical protein
MKTVILATLLLSSLALPLAGAQTPVTVTLQVGTYAGNHRDCAVTVPAGSNVGDVLDQAVEDGCLLSWSSQEFPGYGRYVDCIDYVCGALLTYWAFYVDGGYANFGIDATIVEPGATYGFRYEQFLVPL